MFCSVGISNVGSSYPASVEWSILDATTAYSGHIARSYCLGVHLKCFCCMSGSYGVVVVVLRVGEVIVVLGVGEVIVVLGVDEVIVVLGLGGVSMVFGVGGVIVVLGVGGVIVVLGVSEVIVVVVLGVGEVIVVVVCEGDLLVDAVWFAVVLCVGGAVWVVVLVVLLVVVVWEVLCSVSISSVGPSHLASAEWCI